MPKPEKLQVNTSQKTAVEHEKGPILVVAGAGTGKTRVITERIKHLMLNKGCGMDDILALTFTEKAAREMSDRAGDVMPLGYNEPWIYTFHSFADRILKAEGIEMGIDPSYKILSGPQQWLLIRKNLFRFNLHYFRPLGNPTKFISSILKFISRLQDEYISAEDFQNYVDELTETDEEELNRMKELAYIYRRYQDLKIENSKFDFGDLITWTIKLFEERPNILKKYQEQFKHILVDEFQDTNYSQYLLIKKLFPPTTPTGNRSLLVVGDDSQSIYKFRGAAVSNILEFMKDYPAASMVTLLENYRSTQEILDPAYRVVQNNNPDTLEAKLGISKELTAVNGTLGQIPEIAESETLEDEVEYVVSKIFEILAKEPTYTYKDIAILARANNHLDPFVLALRKYNLPYQLVGNRGLYDQDEVRDVLAILKVIINPKDSINLYRVLNIDTFQIPSSAISALLSESKHKKQDIWDLIQTGKNEKIITLKDLVTKYQDKITKATPVQFIYNLVNESRYLNQYLSEETIDNKLKIKNLDLFLNIVKKFEQDYRDENKELPTVVDFIDHISLLIEAGDNPAQAEIEDIDTVNLLTVHSSKGLEFPVVFIVNLISGRFPSRNRSDMIEVPEELVKETLPTGDEHLQEERRLFYVGMTRAKKYLYLTFAKNYGGASERKHSGYLDETGIIISAVKPDESLKKKADQKSLFGVESGYRNPVMRKEDFTPEFLSYSQIEAYKTCPLKYKYRYILNVPAPPSHALSFGTTIHDTLRDFHQLLRVKKATLDDLVKIYTKNWQPLGYMDEEHRQYQFSEGLKLLEKYYERHADDKIKPIALERSFNLKIAGIKFYGRIDRVDPMEGGAEIIDYKTGSEKTQKEVDKDDQLAFYAIASKEILKLDPKKLTYYFVESGNKISTTRTDSQLEEKKIEVKKVIDDIKDGKLEPKPGMHCDWCEYKDICPFAYRG